MEQNTLKKVIWDSAAKAGLILGAISSAYMFATQYLSASGLHSMAIMAINTLLWIGKFAGIIWLMMFYMKRLVKACPEADNMATFRLGFLISIFSALIYAAVSFANYAFISPDLMTDQLNAVIQQMGDALDSNTIAELDKLSGSFPQISFFSNLIYCTIYGTILSAILSRTIPSKDPFADYKPDEQ